MKLFAYPFEANDFYIKPTRLLNLQMIFLFPRYVEVLLSQHVM